MPIRAHGRQPGRRHERLDDPGHRQHDDQAEGDGDHRARPPRPAPAIAGRGPGSTHDQPSRSPAPAATKTAVSSSSPCGRIRPKNSPPRSLATISPPISPRLSGVLQQHVGHEDAGDAEGDALRGHPGVVGPDLRRERRRRRTRSSTPRSRSRRAGGSPRGEASAACTSGLPPTQTPARAATARKASGRGRRPPARPVQRRPGTRPRRSARRRARRARAPRSPPTAPARPATTAGRRGPGRARWSAPRTGAWRCAGRAPPARRPPRRSSRRRRSSASSRAHSAACTATKASRSTSSFQAAGGRGEGNLTEPSGASVARPGPRRLPRMRGCHPSSRPGPAAQRCDQLSVVISSAL